MREERRKRGGRRGGKREGEEEKGEGSTGEGKKMKRGEEEEELQPAVSWPEDSQLPEVVRCFMIASNKQCHDGGHFLTRVVLWSVSIPTSSHSHYCHYWSNTYLVKGVHLSVLLWHSHAVEISIITHCLHTGGQTYSSSPPSIPNLLSTHTLHTSPLLPSHLTWKSPQQMSRSILTPSLSSTLSIVS